MTKNDIVRALAQRNGYRSCLVLRTKLTGPDCAVDQTQFAIFHHLIYRTPGSDFGIEWGLISLDYYDIALLDPWHGYAESLRDLHDVYARLNAGGVMVCHDCWPSAEITRPDGWDACLRGGAWSGVTFMAWVQFILDAECGYCTVDTDYGCGVAFKGRAASPPNPLLTSRWQDSKADHQQAHAFLSGEGRPLLNLVGPEQFMRENC